MSIFDAIVIEAKEWEELVQNPTHFERRNGALQALRYLSDRLCYNGLITADERKEIWAITVY